MNFVFKMMDFALRMMNFALKIDGPLAECTDSAGYTLPFVSVAPTLEQCPEALRGMHVGGLEAGTAACLVLMNAARLEAGFGERADCMPRGIPSASTQEPSL